VSHNQYYPKQGSTIKHWNKIGHEWRFMGRQAATQPWYPSLAVTLPVVYNRQWLGTRMSDKSFIPLADTNLIHRGRHTRAHIHTHARANTHTHTRTHTQTHTHAHWCVTMHTRLHTYTHTSACTHAVVVDRLGLACQ